MAFALSRIDRVQRRYTITATELDGDPATLDGVQVAALPPRTSPTGATTWTTVTFEDGAATVLLAGPDADPDGAVVVPSVGADLWVRATDSPEVTATKVERITVT